MPRAFSASIQARRFLADGRVDARHRLVEQQNLGRHHQGRGELDELALAIGEVGRLLTAHMAEPEHLDQLADAPAKGGVAVGRAPILRHLGGGRRPPQRRDQEILLDSQGAVDPGRLEGPDEPRLRQPVRREARDLVAVEMDRAAIRALRAGNAVERGRLARSVGPDEADELAGSNDEGDVVDCLHRPKMAAKVAHLQPARRMGGYRPDQRRREGDHGRGRHADPLGPLPSVRPTEPAAQPCEHVFETVGRGDDDDEQQTAVDDEAPVSRRVQELRHDAEHEARHHHPAQAAAAADEDDHQKRGRHGHADGIGADHALEMSAEQARQRGQRR